MEKEIIDNLSKEDIEDIDEMIDTMAPEKICKILKFNSEKSKKCLDYCSSKKKQHDSVETNPITEDDDLSKEEIEDINEMIKSMTPEKIIKILKFNNSKAKKCLDYCSLKTNKNNSERAEIQSLIENNELTKEDKDRINEMLDMSIELDKIPYLLKFNKSKAEKCIAFFSQLKQSKPEPINCKKVKVDIQSHLPLFHYNNNIRINNRKYYTFLVVGESGTGKTTLLDAFVNFICGIDFHDSWRWKLVDESDITYGGQRSQTSEIKINYINDEKNEFNVKIIDTPGFGDTNGILEDNKIQEKFEKLFQNEELDYILMVVKSTESRMRLSSMYVYDRVKQLFGKDAEDRFILMCTFADGSDPVVLKTLENVFNFNVYFSFNNSVLYTPDINNFHNKMYWKICMTSIENFKKYLKNANKRPISTELAKKVLENRKYLQEYISSSQKILDDSYDEFQKTKAIYEDIVKNRRKIDENKDYEFTKTFPTFKVTGTSDKFIQMCSICQTTCCQSCSWNGGESESPCSYFHGGRNCPVCELKCPRNAHTRTNQIIVKYIETQKYYLDNKKNEYDEGSKGFSLSEKLLKENIGKIEELRNKIVKLLKDIMSKVEELEKIALSNKVFSEISFYEDMVEQEKFTKKEGWETKVKYLNNIIKEAKNLEQLNKSKNVEELFPSYKPLENIINKPQELTKEFNNLQSKCVIF